MGEPAIWLVYSREHNAWWRPKAAGYTTLIEGAGRYTKDDAERHCRSRDFVHPDNPPEVACLAPEAEDIIADLLEALKLAEDVLSRFPYSTEMWPNGTHPQTGIVQIRTAIARAEPKERADD